MRPRAERLKPVTNSLLALLNKPDPATGFWTSTYVPGVGSAWVDVALDKHAHKVLTRRKTWRRGWLLRPHDARIAVVDSAQAWLGLLNRYPLRSYPGFPELDVFLHMPLLDFEALAADFDALHVTHEGYAQARFGEYGDLSLYAWDCESTLWFRWCFRDVMDLGGQWGVGRRRGDNIALSRIE